MIAEEWVPMIDAGKPCPKCGRPLVWIERGALTNLPGNVDATVEGERHRRVLACRGCRRPPNYCECPQQPAAPSSEEGLAWTAPPEGKREAAEIEGRLTAAVNAVQMGCTEGALLCIEEARVMLEKLNERLRREETEHGEPSGERTAGQHQLE
jgi:hypothetical protein